MRLDELIGVRKYRNRTVEEWLSDFRAAGGWEARGQFGIVVGYPTWDFVYKFFPHDDCYLEFVNWARAHPHPCLPRFFSAPRQVVPFYQRPRSEDTVWIVKLEKLLPVERKPVTELHNFIVNSQHYYEIVGHRDAERAFLEMNPEPVYAELMNQYRNIWLRDPKLKQACEYFWETLVLAPVHCQLDLHWGNMMQRRDGTYVFSDPYWYGEDPIAMHNRIMKAEMGVSYEQELVSGRKRYNKKKPELPAWDSDQEIPF